MSGWFFHPDYGEDLMGKTVRSWSKPDGMSNLIGRKKVDWSVFEYGSHIPIEFHEDFEKANDST